MCDENHKKWFIMGESHACHLLAHIASLMWFVLRRFISLPQIVMCSVYKLFNAMWHSLYVVKFCPFSQQWSWNPEIALIKNKLGYSFVLFYYSLALLFLLICDGECIYLAFLRYRFYLKHPNADSVAILYAFGEPKSSGNIFRYITYYSARLDNSL